jgi:hypothetical protein
VSGWTKTDLPDFDKWWLDHGQFMRSGGTEYSRTFAYEAWKHLKGVQGAETPVESETRTLYFVSYSFSSPTRNGSGWVAMLRERPIAGVEDIEGLQKIIQDGDPSLGKVCLTGWQRFEEQ